jgi:methionine synthase I (cobalamin-dependent)
MNKMWQWLQKGPLLTDGAWGTQLQEHGLPPGECPDIWNITNPAAVSAVARSYVEAGSNVILTNTFRANPICLPEEWAGRAIEINKAGVRISKEAAAGRALVFASIGPTGKMLLTGEVPDRDVKSAYDLQAHALAEAGADALVIETQSDPYEAEAILRSARLLGLPVVVSFTFDTGRARDRTMTGATPEQAAQRMARAGADVIGANCGSGIESFPMICQRLKESCTLPVWIKANAGLPVMRDGKLHYRQTAEEFATYVPSLLNTGASFVGGCCGSDPAYIRAMRTEIDRYVPDSSRPSCDSE